MLFSEVPGRAVRSTLPQKFLRASLDGCKVSEIEFQKYRFLSRLLLELLDSSAGFLLISSSHIYFCVVFQENLSNSSRAIYLRLTLTQIQDV